MSNTALPELDLEPRITHDGEAGGPCVVILYNCDCHTMDEVIVQLQKACGCAIEKAVEIALEAHIRGRAIAFSGSSDDCERVAGVLRSIRLQVETDRL